MHTFLLLSKKVYSMKVNLLQKCKPLFKLLTEAENVQKDQREVTLL